MPTTAETLQRIKELVAQLGEVMHSVQDLAAPENQGTVFKAHQISSEIFERLSIIKNLEYEIKVEPVIKASDPVPVLEPAALTTPVQPTTLFEVEPVETVKPEPKKVSAPKKSTNLKKIDDLKAAVGLNEKFRFINELFGGNQQEYSIAINQLNTVPDIEEALIYYDTLKNIYNWDTAAECYIKLLELVHRRFA